MLIPLRLLDPTQVLDECRYLNINQNICGAVQSQTRLADMHVSQYIICGFSCLLGTPRAGMERVVHVEIAVSTKVVGAFGTSTGNDQYHGALVVARRNPPVAACWADAVRLTSDSYAETQLVHLRISGYDGTELVLGLPSGTLRRSRSTSLLGVPVGSPRSPARAPGSSPRGTRTRNCSCQHSSPLKEAKTDLRARCGLDTTMRPQTSQSVGTSHILLPHRGQRYPPFFSKP